jgi:hypothetical protein
LEKNEEIIWLIELKSRILRTDFRNFSEQVKKDNNVKSLSGHRKEGSDRKQCFPLEEKDQKKVYGQPVYQKVLSARGEQMDHPQSISSRHEKHQ